MGVQSLRVVENKPFLKWPGGKRWLVDKYIHLLPKSIQGRYFEPFVGGGALFFALQPAQAILSDICSDVVATYLGVRNQAKQVQARLSEHAISHCSEYYYRVRSEEPKLLADRAARIIYLNRTCFNGIYRVNRAGKFNVPIGSRVSVDRNEDFTAWSKVLKCAKIEKSDFEDILDHSTEGDFAFVDPPYSVTHNQNGFVKYNEVLFSWDDQRRLHDCLVRARDRGVTILMTNANHESIRALYRDGFKQTVVSRHSSIAARSSKRNRYEEVIVQC